PELLERLRAEKFDAAYSEFFHYCAPVLFRMLGIDKFAITDSVAMNDAWFYYTQTPSNPSYVPTMMGTIGGERMSFFERAHNAYIYSLMDYFYKENARLFQQELAKKFPDLPPVRDLMGENSLVFVNSEPLVDFPRPTSSRIIDIGGITVASEHGPLEKKWSDMLGLRPRTIFLSFGTVAKAYLMPEQYMRTIIQVLKKFPEVTFIMKYEKPTNNISAGVPNLIEATWVPQRELLHDPRLSAFITHCGQGSTTEAIDAGIPIIVIPVLADQYRNAHQVVRSGTGIVLEKAQLNSIEPLEAAIREILENPRWISSCIFSKKFNNHSLNPSRWIFVKNMEFLAKHGPLRQLDHHGRHLNFFQYYLLDVIGVVLFVASLITALLICVAIRVVLFVRSIVVVKRKSD
ncbi:hypothetical protein PMAYCL1PPCAC_19851, partial [Pristionchus mayeri]